MTLLPALNLGKVAGSSSARVIDDEFRRWSIANPWTEGDIFSCAVGCEQSHGKWLKKKQHRKKMVLVHVQSFSEHEDNTFWSSQGLIQE